MKYLFLAFLLSGNAAALEISSAITVGSVDTPKLGSGSVTVNKLGAGAVDTVALGSGAVTINKILAGAVDTVALGSGAVDTRALLYTTRRAEALVLGRGAGATPIGVADRLDVNGGLNAVGQITTASSTTILGSGNALAVPTGNVSIGAGANGINPATKLHMSSGTLTIDGTAATLKLGDGTNAGTATAIKSSRLVGAGRPRHAGGARRPRGRAWGSHSSSNCRADDQMDDRRRTTDGG